MRKGGRREIKPEREKVTKCRKEIKTERNQEGKWEVSGMQGRP